ncbi:MAG: dauA 2 [Rickettsiaceae bacterium]|jgi:SulP family sulfate permease|nr:dauA 2 [Rickettsiaceae bacterium]
MKIFNILKHDLLSGLIVFFVALPLCLGIALASGAPLFSGIIAGVIGGIIVGSLSGSALGVSGPAAGLATIVFANIAALGGSWESFLLVTLVAGIIQLTLGCLRMGTIAYYFPSSVIKGMLAGIGILIIVKQIPYLIGYDSNFGEESENISNIAIFTKIGIEGSFTIATILIGLISLVILIIWEFLAKFHNFFKAIPAALAVVLIGIGFYNLIAAQIIPFPIPPHHLVEIPVSSSAAQFLENFYTPDFTQITNPQIYVMAIVLAIVASLETLLSVEAIDKIDPEKRITPANTELKAQGVGNIISGLIGGLPITQVIVRSSANATFGAKSKASTIFHGIILLFAVILIPQYLNMIPLASLAAILIFIGYKLAKPSIFTKTYKLGSEQFFPFIITIVGMVAFDLLKGVGFGMAVALGYVIYHNLKNSYHRTEDSSGKHKEHIFKLAEEVSFLNKGGILQMLKSLEKGSKVVIDGSNSRVIHHDVVELIRDFQTTAKSKNIELELRGIDFRKFK